MSVFVDAIRTRTLTYIESTEYLRSHTYRSHQSRRHGEQPPTLKCVVEFTYSNIFHYESSL